MSSRRILLSSRCKSLSHRIVIGRARLYTDRLVVFGLQRPIGWTRQTILVKDVATVSWYPEMQQKPNLVLTRTNGTRVALRLEHVGLWKFKLEELRGGSLNAALPAAEDEIVDELVDSEPEVPVS